MPLKTKINGKARYIKDREAICFTEDQAKHIYEKVKREDIVNVETIKQEIEANKLDKMEDTNGKINTCHKQ